VLGIMEVALIGLAVLVVGLVLRLRQHEPAAVARLGDRAATVRSELALMEARIVTVREELATHDAELGPLRSERDAVASERDAARAELGRIRDELLLARAELDASAVELAQQRAARAEAEVALRVARGAIDGRGGGRAATTEAAAPAVPRTRPDLGAIVADATVEPAMTGRSGPVRPTTALPPRAEPQQDRTHDAKGTA